MGIGPGWTSGFLGPCDMYPPPPPGPVMPLPYSPAYPVLQNQCGQSMPVAAVPLPLPAPPIPPSTMGVPSPPNYPPPEFARPSMVESAGTFTPGGTPVPPRLKDPTSTIGDSEKDNLKVEGKVGGIIGGPPCTTFSRARSRSAGPRVLRARQGPERFGFAHLTGAEATQVFQDSSLILRMLLLMHVAKEATGDRCFFALEHPRDPSLLEHARQPIELPSLWTWPELESFNLFKAELDQGRLGHTHVKPTTLATNSWSLYESLHNVVVLPKDRWVVADTSKDSLEQRIATTRKAAAWAPGLVAAIQKAWSLWVSEQDSGLSLGVRRLQELAEALKNEAQEVSALERVCQALSHRAEASLNKLSEEEKAFKRHVECGHTPWRKDCRTCVYTAAHRSPCRRRKYPHVYTLCVDLAGPFKPGTDYTGSAKYAVVGVYTYPKFWKGGEPVPDKVAGESRLPNAGEPHLPETPRGRDTKRGHPEPDLPETPRNRD